MKEAIGGISLFQIVIVFILLFTAVMCLTINHSKAFGVKDEIITILETEASEKYVNTDAIAEHLQEAGYRLTGNCPEGFTGYTREGDPASGRNASFCLKYNSVVEEFEKDLKDKCSNNKCKVPNKMTGYPNMGYYDVVLFYQLDVPIIGSAFDFRLTGSTKILFG